MGDYIGTITGIIGAITGIAGVITGWLGCSKSKHIKSLDLRLELRKGLASAHHELATARSLLELGAHLRRRILAATGHGQSGNMVAWNQAVAADSAALDRIAPMLRSETADFTTLKDRQLESEIVAAHRLVAELSGTSAKYREAFQADEERRREIRRNVVDRTNQMMAANERGIQR